MFRLPGKNESKTNPISLFGKYAVDGWLRTGRKKDC